MPEKKIAIDVYRIIEAVVAGLIVIMLTNIISYNRVLNARIEESNKNIIAIKDGGYQLTISVLPIFTIMMSFRLR